MKRELAIVGPGTADNTRTLWPMLVTNTPVLNDCREITILPTIAIAEVYTAHIAMKANLVPAIGLIKIARKSDKTVLHRVDSVRDTGDVFGRSVGVTTQAG